MKKQTSDTVQTAVRYEARKWREESTGTKKVLDEVAREWKDEPTTYAAEWAVYDIESGVRMEYSADEAAARATAEKWKSGKIPEAKQDKAESCRYLKTILHPGDEVKTILRSVSRSGMSRRISLVVARDNEVTDITFHAARTMGEKVKQGWNWVQDAGWWLAGAVWIWGSR